MNLLSFISTLNPIKSDLKKKEPKKIIHQSRFNRDQLRFTPIKSGFDRSLGNDEEQREALIQSGRQQFKKLVDLGLKIPIAVL